MVGNLCIGSTVQVVTVAMLFKIHFNIILRYFTFYIHILHFIF